MARTPSTMLPLGTPLPHFELIDTDGGDVPDGEELTTGTDPLDPADG